MIEAVSASSWRAVGAASRAYAADDHSLGLFPSPRKAAAAITTTCPWVAVPSTLLARADEVTE
jgi:hypothetical protein